MRPLRHFTATKAADLRGAAAQWWLEPLRHCAEAACEGFCSAGEARKQGGKERRTNGRRCIAATATAPRGQSRAQGNTPKEGKIEHKCCTMLMRRALSWPYHVIDGAKDLLVCISHSLVVFIANKQHSACEKGCWQGQLRPYCPEKAHEGSKEMRHSGAPSKSEQLQEGATAPPQHTKPPSKWERMGNPKIVELLLYTSITRNH